MYSPFSVSHPSANGSVLSAVPSSFNYVTITRAPTGKARLQDLLSREACIRVFSGKHMGGVKGHAEIGSMRRDSDLWKYDVGGWNLVVAFVAAYVTAPECRNSD